MISTHLKIALSQQSPCQIPRSPEHRVSHCGAAQFFINASDWVL